MDGAAASALDAYTPLSQARNREYAGLLYELDGEHYATPGVAGTADRSNANRATVYLPEGATVEGYWHTHGSYDFTLDDSLHFARGQDWNERFSRLDIGFSLSPTTPGSLQWGYVGTPAGMMYRFAPGPGVTDLNVVPVQVGGNGWLGGYGLRKPL